MFERGILSGSGISLSFSSNPSFLVPVFEEICCNICWGYHWEVVKNLAFHLGNPVFEGILSDIIGK